MINLKKIQIKSVKFGTNVKVIEPVNLYQCIIDSNCFIGPFVEIQKDAVLGKNNRVQSHTFICSKVKIGNNCFIGHGVMFTNDRFEKGKPSGKNKFRSTIISDNVYIGSNSTILPIKICSKVVIGAGSVVTKNITKPGIYCGNPAKFLRSIK
jgi:acetyltransferase-like isoleucine patch superfamily enzyme